MNVLIGTDLVLNIQLQSNLLGLRGVVIIDDTFPLFLSNILSQMFDSYVTIAVNILTIIEYFLLLSMKLLWARQCPIDLRFSMLLVYLQEHLTCF